MSRRSLTRRRFATIASAGLAVGLAGCGDDENPEEPAGPGNGGTGNGEGEDPVEEDDGED